MRDSITYGSSSQTKCGDFNYDSQLTPFGDQCLSGEPFVVCNGAHHPTVSCGCTKKADSRTLFIVSQCIGGVSVPGPHVFVSNHDGTLPVDQTGTCDTTHNDTGWAVEPREPDGRKRAVSSIEPLCKRQVSLEFKSKTNSTLVAFQDGTNKGGDLRFGDCADFIVDCTKEPGTSEFAPTLECSCMRIGV